MDLLHTIILAFVEGFTEFLPISSTGHLILVSQLLKISSTEFSKSFDIIIQSGAILAVVFLYFQRLFKDFATSKKLLVAFIPTGVLGLLTYKIIKTYLLGNVSIVLWSLLIGGLVMIALEYYFKERNQKGKRVEDLNYKESAVIGLVQSLSLIPGVSRAAATIFGGMFVGLSRKEAVEMSFMLSIPTMFAATGYDLLKSYKEFNSQEFGTLFIGFIVAFVFAYISIKWLLKYVSNHNFIMFGIYRIVVALGFFFFLS